MEKSSRNLDAVVVGNVGIDTNVYSQGEINWSVEANFTENIDYVGQAGGYASRGFAQLGKRTAFIGYVGDDFSGRFIHAEFERDGIDMRGMFIDPAGTSRSVNIMFPDGRRKNFYDGKSHMTLRPDMETCRAILADARLAHFNIPNWARYLLPIAKEYGLTISCDIQDVVSLDDDYRRDFINYADILFFSAVNFPDPTAAIRSFLDRNPDLIIVVGMGARGCALGSKQSIRFVPPISMDLPVIDTNGAGDGLAVGFLSSYVLDHYSLQDSVRRGQLVARYTCSIKASSSNLITPDRLERYMKS